MSFNQLMDMARAYLPAEKMAMVEDAYNYALEAHQDQVRKSGGPYMEHPLQVALSIAELSLMPALWPPPCCTMSPRTAGYLLRRLKPSLARR